MSVGTFGAQNNQPLVAGVCAGGQSVAGRVDAAAATTGRSGTDPLPGRRGYGACVSISRSGCGTYTNSKGLSSPSTCRINVMQKLRLIVAVSISATLLTRAAVPDDDRKTSLSELRESVDALIEKFDSNSRADRVRAEREMIRLGTRILPLLPPREKLATAAQRATVRRIRIQLERKKARDSVLASTVMQLQSKDLGSIVKEISQQTGNAITVGGFTGQPIVLDVDDEPFWPLIDRLGGFFSREPVFSDDGRGLVLKPVAKSATASRLLGYSGPFRVTAQSGQLRPIFGDESDRLLRIPITIMSEPRLRPLLLKYSAMDVTAHSGKANLPPMNAGAKYELSMGRGGKQIQRNLEFRIPKTLSNAKVTVHAKMTMLTAAGTEQFAFLDIADAKGVARRRGGVTVSIRKVSFRRTSKTEHAARVRIAVTYDVGGPAFESHQRWMLHNKSELRTAGGKRIIQNSGFDISLELDGAIEVEYRFDGLTNDSGEYRFVYEAPTLLINVPIEFELKDIPIAKQR